MVKLFNWLVERLMSRSKKPWARLLISGVDKNNEVRFDVAYNKAFIRNLDKQGLTGANDDETIENFLFGTFMAPKSIMDEYMSLNENGGVASDAHPNLSSEVTETMKGFRFRNGNQQNA